MNQAPTALKPLKTWSHLAGQRRKPSEYEIVTANLHYTTNNPDAPFEADPDFPMAQWFKQYRNASPLKHPDWNAFRDPDEVIYRTYCIMQDGQETYALGLFDQMSERGHDALLQRTWAGALARLYTPSRYLFHTLQMASAYLVQLAPSSTLSNCAVYQTADSLRWLTHTAYRTAELARTFPDSGLGRDERKYWEEDPAWQGFRELMERVLVAWDWGEAFVALNLVAKPAVEECVLHALGQAGRNNGDTLLGMLTDIQAHDAQRHRKWSGALVKFALQNEHNLNVLKNWIAKWEPLADQAIEAYCNALPDAPGAADKAKLSVREFRNHLGI